MKVFVSTMLFCQILIPAVAQSNSDFFALEYDSVVVHKSNEFSVKLFHNEYSNYFRSLSESDLDEALVISAWKDSVVVLEQAYLGPYKCVATSFSSEYVSAESVIVWEKYSVADLFITGPIIDTTIEIGFHPNGAVSEISYGLFMKHQISQNYDWDGNLLSTSEIKNGMKNGLTKSYYPSGALSSTTNFVDGKPDGFSFEFYEDGSIFVQMQYVNGELNGYVTHYDKTGQVTRSERYLNGVKME